MCIRDSCDGGSDAHSGLSATEAFGSVDKALAALQARSAAAPTTTVSISGTCYRSTSLRLNASHAHAKFVGGPAGGTISGGLAVPPLAWRPGAGSLWTAQLPVAALNASALPNQLWAMGNRRPRARHPNLLAQADDGGLGVIEQPWMFWDKPLCCLLYTSPSPRDATLSRMPSSA